MYLLDFACLQECLDALYQAVSCSYPLLEPAAALPHSTFPDCNMFLLDLPCLQGCLDDLHQALSSSCQTLEPATALHCSSLHSLTLLMQISCTYHHSTAS